MAPPRVVGAGRHHRQALLHWTYAFIDERLGDPKLSPGMVAAACHISLRYLHRLFQEPGATVAGWIRQRRLEGCRRDLTDPALVSRTVAAIAGRWGFGSPAHFSHASGPVGAGKSVVGAELRVRHRRCRATMIGTWLFDCSICCSARW